MSPRSDAPMDVHYTPEKHDQAACGRGGNGELMWGTFNPAYVTCVACNPLREGVPVTGTARPDPQPGATR